MSTVTASRGERLHDLTSTALRRATAAVLLVLLVLAAYQRAPENGYHLDDWDNVVDHPPVHMWQFSLAALWRAAAQARIPTRPLPSVTFAIDWWRGGGSPRPFLQTNVALHALTAIAVLAFFCVLTSVASGHDPPTWRGDAAAFAGAALWALHPLHVQSVSYVVQRMNVLATLFVLLGLLLWLHGRWRAGRPVVWIAASAGAFALAALSKENAWVAPALLLLVEAGLLRRGRALLGGTVERLVAALLALAAAWIAFDLASGAGPVAHYVQAGYAEREFTLEQRLLTQPRVIAFYLSLFLWPFPGRFSIEHDFTVSTGLLSPPATAFALSGVVLWCVLGAWLLLRTKHRHVGMVLLWLPLTLAIESSVIALEMVFEHRMYLPSVALCSLAAIALLTLVERGRAARTVALLCVSAIVGALMFSTATRVAQWRSELTLLQGAVIHAPGSARVRSNLSKAQLLAGDASSAARSARRALERDAAAWPALETLGVIALDRGDTAAAAAWLERALRAGGPRHSLLNHLGEAYFHSARERAARDLFARAVEAAPRVSGYRWNFALALERVGACARAYAEWQAFLGLDADDADRARVREHLAERYPRGVDSCAERGTVPSPRERE